MEKFLVSIRLLFFLAVAIIHHILGYKASWLWLYRQEDKGCKAAFPQFPRAHEDFYQCTEILHVYH